MSLRRYFALTRSSILEQLHFRLGTFITFLGNVIYLTLVYFLWKSIYASSGKDTVAGMSFNDTLIYLVLATALFNFLEMFIVWDMSRKIQSGEIILHLLKPMGFKSYTFWSYFGANVVTFFLTFLPTFVIIDVLTGGAIQLNTNCLFFVISVAMALIINFNIDMFVATICLYTESTWGINIVKESIVLLFSGATIPLVFFPQALRKVVALMPFRSIYDTPLNILLMKDGYNLSGGPIEGGLLEAMLIQFFWCIVLSIISTLFWKVSVRQITVNGG